jgi:diguanylate cyclase (GGDEF)-like protein
MINILASLQRLPGYVVGALALVQIALVGLLDYLTGSELAFFVFYLAPILTVTWYGTRALGVATAALCASIWTGVILLAQPLYSNPIAPYWNAAVRLALFLLVVYIVSALKNALRYEQVLARTDTLTGVANSRAFYEHLEDEIERARRYKRTFTLAYVDVDDFKMINDRFGHSVGDDLLCVMADTLRAQVRSTDVVARLGGDEFAILFVETGYQMAERTLARVRSALAEALERRGWPTSCSIGAVTCSGHVEGVNSVLQRADELMYAVKRSTKNDVRHERYHVSDQVA